MRAGASALAQQRLDVVPLDRALADLAATLLLGCAVWLWLESSYVVIEAGRGRAPRLVHGLAPGLGPSIGARSGIRRLVLSACGIAVAGALAQPAVGVTADAGRLGHRAHTIVHAPVSGLPLPERAAVAGPPEPTPRRGRRQPTGASVVVVPGDTLWSIAARDLPPGSPDQVIARRWRAIYAANRGRIGPDPDLIVPGLHLHLPRRDLS